MRERHIGRQDPAAIHLEGVTMDKDRKEDSSPTEIEDGYIDDADRSLDPYGRFLRHNYMHEGLVPIVLDEFGRCAYCIKNGHWRPNA
jgi:hypothetical protein